MKNLCIVIIIIVVYGFYSCSFMTQERMYYLPEISMYVKVERKASDRDNLYIYLGKNQSDIHKTLDYVKVRDAGDSILLGVYFAENSDTIHLMSYSGILETRQLCYSMKEINPSANELTYYVKGKGTVVKKEYGITHMIIIYSFTELFLNTYSSGISERQYPIEN